MGISRIAFLFDVDKFKNTFQPFIGELENNNYANLRTVSTQKVKNNPSLWKVLDYFGYFESDIDREEEEFDTIESRVMFWINILVAESCNDAITDPVNARVIGEILPLLKIESDIVSKLQVGKPFGVLLLPQRRQEEMPLVRGTHQERGHRLPLLREGIVINRGAIDGSAAFDDCGRGTDCAGPAGNHACRRAGYRGAHSGASQPALAAASRAPGRRGRGRGDGRGRQSEQRERRGPRRPRQDRCTAHRV